MEAMKQCPRCHTYVPEKSAYCNKCGYAFPGADGVNPPSPTQVYAADNPFDACGPEGKSRGVAALLAIFLGFLGIQYFYLGKTGAGILSIVISLVSCGLWEFITLIQGILMFCMTNEQFRQKYVITPASFPIF